ncbi:MAG: ribonuclease T2 [Magnetospirillum sp.]|nr:ribonuclease T2 [Magnetospirillum sp.]
MAKSPLIAALVASAFCASAAMADQCGPTRGRPGQFDYYLLSLSWAPSYCATPSGRQNRQECGPGTDYGMVVHGLWPQFTNGQWPQCCQAVAPLTPSPTIDKLSRIMIGSSLMEHEWEKHGSCVTTRQDAYFGSIGQVVAKLGLAPTLSAKGITTIKVSELKRHWSLPAPSITTRCKGKRLGEIHICLDLKLDPIACPAAEIEADNCPGSVALH